MRLTDVFSAASIAAHKTENPSNKIPYLGSMFFPVQKKTGIDLKWIKTHKGLTVALAPSAYDTIPVLRSREGFKEMHTKMPFFRESMQITEEDALEIERARDINDPFLGDVVANIYNDADELMEAAEIVGEAMRMSLLAPQNNGKPEIVFEADNTKYAYDYDPDGSWKATNYVSMSGTALWSATTAKPLTDIQNGKKALTAKGISAKYLLMNSTTLEMLVTNDQIKGVIVAQNATGAGIFMTADKVKDVIKAETGLTILVYDKLYKNYAGAETKFYPDGFATIIGESKLGKLYRGTTPEERTLMGNPEVNVKVVDGIAVTVREIPGPPVETLTTVSEVTLPSYEGMDAVYVMKVA